MLYLLRWDLLFAVAVVCATPIVKQPVLAALKIKAAQSLTPPSSPVTGHTTNIYHQVSGVGSFGGSCICPDGELHQVGDNEDNCATLACVGGLAGTCEKFDRPSRSGFQLICGSVSSSLFANAETIDTEVKKLVAEEKDQAYRMAKTMRNPGKDAELKELKAGEQATDKDILAASADPFRVVDANRSAGEKKLMQNLRQDERLDLFFTDEVVKERDEIDRSGSQYTRAELLHNRQPFGKIGSLLRCFTGFAKHLMGGKPDTWTIAGGTLLGWARDGNVIAYDHDADVDMGHELREKLAQCTGRGTADDKTRQCYDDVISQSDASTMSACAGIALETLDWGHRMRVTSNGDHYPFLDIAGSWLPQDMKDRSPEGTAAVTAGAKAANRSVTDYVYLPFKPCTIGPWSISVMCLARPTDYLRLFYGEEWRTPLYSVYDEATHKWTNPPPISQGKDSPDSK